MVDQDDEVKAVLGSSGDAIGSVSVLYKGPSVRQATVSDSDPFSAGTISAKGTADSHSNCIVPLAFDKSVGKGLSTAQFPLPALSLCRMLLRPALTAAMALMPFNLALLPITLRSQWWRGEGIYLCRVYNCSSKGSFEVACRYPAFRDTWTPLSALQVLQQISRRQETLSMPWN